MSKREFEKKLFFYTNAFILFTKIKFSCIIVLWRFVDVTPQNEKGRDVYEKRNDGIF